VFAAALFSTADADLYLHSFRGSNNRLDEANRDRNNANRLFDSQNNNRGGYNVGSVYYGVGSKAYFQWTAQHSCGSASNDCEIVWQYMCDSKIRDGANTRTIPEIDSQCYNADKCDDDLEYGMQESNDYYYTCTATMRNMGLFTAGQNLQNDARFTRQNPNGGRYGYECPEERDYYPYWRPSPWVDMAIMTNTPTRCADYLAKSENVLGRWYCEVPQAMYEAKKATLSRAWIPIEKTACEALFYQDPVDPTVITYATWKQAPSHGMAPPECVQNRWSRDNHLGNVPGGYMASYNWTVPDMISETCAFRVRYNITTNEYPAWKDAFSAEVGEIDSRNNSLFREPDRQPAELKIWETYDVDFSEVADSFDRNLNGAQSTLVNSREYVFKNNPKVDMFGSLLTSTPGYLKLQMNINTNQFGRTFQDRSHRFAVRAASAECAGVMTHNLQVRGKRGNIVQTYPGMEYDFVPDRLDIAVGECFHIQWTGSNTNPNNNDGQGKQGTDRSNMVQQAAKVYDEEGQPSGYHGQFGRSFPEHISSSSFLGLSDADEQSLAILSKSGGPQFGGENSELDDAATYFDLGPRKMTVSGIWHYLCTRNNNFSNRSQKGKVVSSNAASVTQAIGWNGGSVQAMTGASVSITEGTFTTAVEITLQHWPASEEDQNKWNLVSDYTTVYMSQAAPFKISIPFDNLWSVNGHQLYYHSDFNAVLQPVPKHGWSKIDATYENAVAQATAPGPGIYVVTQGPVDLALAVMLPLLLIAALGAGGYYFMQHRKKQTSGKAYERASSNQTASPKDVKVVPNVSVVSNPPSGKTTAGVRPASKSVGGKETTNLPAVRPASQSVTAKVSGPKAAGPKAAGPKAAGPKAAAKSVIKAQQWQALEDPQSGSTYYFNETTNETTWDKPAGF